MTAIFKIDQPGWVPPPPPLPAWDRARRDIQLMGTGGPVTFTARDPAASYLWELISEPPGPATPIVGPNFPACQVAFTKTGGYLMRLTVNAGIPATEDISVRYVGIRLTNSNLPIPAFNELDFDNSVDPTGSVGASEKLTEFFKWVDANVGSGMGNLPITRTYYVDGARSDIYVEDGSFGFPFKTITAGIAAAAFESIAHPAEYCLHIRPFKYQETNVVLPGNIHIDAELGSELVPPIGVDSDGLVVVPGAVAPLAGVTFIRGLNIAGRGAGKWALKIQMPLPSLPFVAFVAHLDACLGTYETANLMFVETGGLYLTDAGGYYGDSTNDIGLRVAPPGPAPIFQSVALIGMWNISANKHAFDIGIGGAVLAADTKVDVNVSPATGSMLYIDGGSPSLGALFMSKNLRIGGDWLGLVEQHGVSFVQMDTVDGNNPVMLSSYLTDIFQIHGGYLFLSGGAYSTPQGRGLALLADEADVYGWFKNVDISSEPGGVSSGYLIETSNLPGPPGVGTSVVAEIFDCRFRAQNAAGRQYTHFAHTQGNIYLDGGAVEGGGGGSTTIDHVGAGGLLWLTGGVDINANQWSDIAIHVAPNAIVAHGHANVRVGQVVFDPGAIEMPLTSSFAGINLGKYDAITKWVSRQTLAEVQAGGGEDGYHHGSIAVITGGAVPLVYINYGTNAARDWRLLGSGTPTVRVQREDMGGLTPINLSGKTRTGPALLPISWQTTDYDDVPPFSIWDPRIVQVSEEGDYKLSYHLIWQNDAVLAFGTTVGVMWEKSTDGGMSWTEITPTLSYDSTPNVFNNYGSNDLAPYELHLALGTCLRLKAWLAGINGNVYINAFDVGPAYENGSWARIERGGGGGGGGGGGTDWTVEFVTVNKVMDATDHKKNLVVLVDSPNTVTVTLPVNPFVGQEFRIIHGGQASYPGPGAGHLTLAKANPADKGIGIADGDYFQLDADEGGNVAHLLCIDSGGGLWGSRFWGCGNGSGYWYDGANIGTGPTPPYQSNQFYTSFISPFIHRPGLGGGPSMPGAIQLNERSCSANAPFAFAFGQWVEANGMYSMAFGYTASTRWWGEEAHSSGSDAGIGGAQRSAVNIYGTTGGPTLSGDLTPTGLNAGVVGTELYLDENKVYACELLVVAAFYPRIVGVTPPLAAAWKLEFLVHGMGAGENAVIVGTKNKNLFSRDPDPIIDPWDVNVSIGGLPGSNHLKVTVTGGVDTVRWDAVLTSAQVSVYSQPS